MEEYNNIINQHHDNRRTKGLHPKQLQKVHWSIHGQDARDPPGESLFDRKGTRVKETTASPLS